MTYTLCDTTQLLLPANNESGMPAPPPKVSGEYFGHCMTLDISTSTCIIGTSMNTVDKV